MAIMQVGRTIKDKKKKAYFTYKDVPFDGLGWADPNTHLPLSYDLCYLKLDKRTVIGWWAGNEWDARRFKKGEKVIAWRRREEE